MGGKKRGRIQFVNTGIYNRLSFFLKYLEMSVPQFEAISGVSKIVMRRFMKQTGLYPSFLNASAITRTLNQLLPQKREELILRKQWSLVKEFDRAITPLLPLTIEKVFFDYRAFEHIATLERERHQG